MWEQIVRRTTFLKNYRCKQCGWRGFRSTIIISKKSWKVVSMYLVLVLLTALIARYIITHFVLG